MTLLALVLTDRLLRFGGEPLFQLSRLGVEDVVLDATGGIFRKQQLTEALVEILTVIFSRVIDIGGTRSRTEVAISVLTNRCAATRELFCTLVAVRERQRESFGIACAGRQHRQVCSATL
ncbi:hypothetical protein JJQ59_28150 [Cupriavidus necator]|uniref:Uncharacterized protein n=1 Tax=Cupriavidus necator TaxID=106590 RepID=A0A367PIL4_CUPNE|nr:hypothetical protein [Cupriavidus necator]QQX86642.1 hypothetical protein JJQ59_28150 [Cupriavidus necator]RCJ06836.1 hypothetical protein DDK22_19495 [Cupriavidus necator]